MLRGSRWLCVLSLLGVVGAFGCGGTDDASTAKQETEFSAASEPPGNFATRLAKLFETTTAKKDCAQLDAINARSYTRFECPPSADLRKSMASFDLVAAKAYGTGAVVDYKSGAAEDGAAIVLFVGPDRNWGIGRFGLITKPSVETSDENSRDGYERLVNRYLKAVRERDCDAYFDVVFTDAPKRVVCGAQFTASERLAKRLRSDPSAKPKYEGGNGTYGFVTIETKKPAPATRLTISVLKNPSGGAKPYAILDAVPGPTTAALRQLRADYRRQQKGKRSSGMQPSQASKKPLPQDN